MQRRMMTSFIFVSLLGIYPFIMSQGYIKILWGKYIYFLFTMIIVTTCVCVEFLKKWFKDEELFSITKIKARLQSWNMIDKSVAVYFVASTMDYKSHFALGKTVGRGAIVLSSSCFDSESSAIFGGEG